MIETTKMPYVLYPYQISSCSYCGESFNNVNPLEIIEQDNTGITCCIGENCVKKHNYLIKIFVME